MGQLFIAFRENLLGVFQKFLVALYILRRFTRDLLFDGTLADRGGRLVTPSGTELLYEIDSGSSGPASSNLIGITAAAVQPDGGTLEIGETVRMAYVDQ